jgi:trehalose utilization protein
MYGETFDVPPPDELVFISSFAGGEVFRSGCGYTRGAGRIFYFSPGDQEYPVYHQPDVRQVLANAVLWAAPALVGEPPENAQAPQGWFERAGA